jgi:hypothetical protein
MSVHVSPPGTQPGSRLETASRTGLAASPAGLQKRRRSRASCSNLCGVRDGAASRRRSRCRVTLVPQTCATSGWLEWNPEWRERVVLRGFPRAFVKSRARPRPAGAGSAALGSRKATDPPPSHPKTCGAIRSAIQVDGDGCAYHVPAGKAPHAHARGQVPRRPARHLHRRRRVGRDRPRLRPPPVGARVWAGWSP